MTSRTETRPCLPLSGGVNIAQLPISRDSPFRCLIQGLSTSSLRDHFLVKRTDRPTEWAFGPVNHFQARALSCGRKSHERAAESDCMADLPIGGQFYVHHWEATTSDNWILSTVRLGLALEFLPPPKFFICCSLSQDAVKRGLMSSAGDPGHSASPSGPAGAGIFSILFFVPKNSGVRESNSKSKMPQQIPHCINFDEQHGRKGPHQLPRGGSFQVPHGGGHASGQSVIFCPHGQNIYRGCRMYRQIA